MDTAFYFLTIFFVLNTNKLNILYLNTHISNKYIALLTAVLKFKVYNLFLCFKFGQHVQACTMYKQISIFYCLKTIKILNVLYSGYFLHLLLHQHGDIERNPGPKI